jgi:integrase
LNEIRGEQISRYQRTRLKEGASNRTINIELALVRLVLGKKRWRDIVEPDEEGRTRVTMLKERKDIGRELSDDEVFRLLSACKNSASRGLYPAVLTSIHMGLRSQELRLLRWRQVDLIEGIITVLCCRQILWQEQDRRRGWPSRLFEHPRSPDTAELAFSVSKRATERCRFSARSLRAEGEEGNLWRRGGPL